MKLGLYIHIPFCKSKCAYCDFLSWRPESQEDIGAYLDLLGKEMALYAPLLRKRKLESVFIGGGTPSLVETEKLRGLLAKLGTYQDLEGLEVTLEANPESLLDQDLEALKKAGVNRLSLGVQSSQDRLLKKIGRIHTADMAKEAFYRAREAGFDNINLDFISGLPGEDRADIGANLAFIRDLDPDHLSYYALIIEENTPLYEARKGGDFEELSQEEDRWRIHHIEDQLEKLGYGQYEISNFAKPGKASRHNRLYWELGEYIGLGLGAHSNLGDRRYWNTDRLAAYKDDLDQDKKPIGGGEDLSGAERDQELAIFGLRMNQGIALDTPLHDGETFSDRYKEVIEDQIQAGLLIEEGGRVRLSRLGRDLAGQVELAFYMA
ncbi:MAG: radical SAM family heme chaperone HemW [Tissierellia bacterium]|nr:radical SAM family heme chaperone HemW [Tissierellia bacterium]